MVESPRTPIAPNDDYVLGSLKGMDLNFMGQDAGPTRPAQASRSFAAASIAAAGLEPIELTAACIAPCGSPIAPAATPFAAQRRWPPFPRSGRGSSDPYNSGIRARKRLQLSGALVDRRPDIRVNSDFSIPDLQSPWICFKEASSIPSLFISMNVDSFESVLAENSVKVCSRVYDCAAFKFCGLDADFSNSDHEDDPKQLEVQKCDTAQMWAPGSSNGPIAWKEARHLQNLLICVSPIKIMK
ncbi:hypothetical protein M9H77_16226 [Catharanthus roseus]|uniref:Uncharacterized protein n=1 Tax=Catharanthus roseus TaxID=4058 RepID=A0ACC0AZD6_CATRO|nr:hypothetical protein M9H77_16226 [Catharanthus roseus]